ncbi:HAD family hydrolase [Micromonospora sp. NPDC092111]|uniref:HAD family hydrolase n=1 Tax=Micromonospora sp. NPDC092111 TaxID=3364289 RepID=UPI003817864B
MPDQPPVLIVDAGGTLVTRTRPGLAGRVLHALRAAGDDRPGALLRAAVLTAVDVDTCLRHLDPLPPPARAAVLAELTGDPGDAVVLPGAEDLLGTAADLGWRVVVATNAGPGTPALPDDLDRHVDTTVESRRCGLVKDDPRFWQTLLAEQDVDPRTALVVGDDPVADRRVPEAAGLQSRLVGGDGTATTELVAQLRAAGSRPDGAGAVVAGRRERWAGRDVTVAPHLAGLVVRVTRARVRLTTGGTGGAAFVVRRRALPPAVVAAGGALPEFAWLHLPRDRRPYQAPADLKALLDAEGLSLEVLPPSDRRHALAMIREARSRAAVSARMADLVLFLRDRGKGGAE